MEELTPVLGELTEDGLYLKVTLAGGNDWHVVDLVARLHSLTPGFTFPKDEPQSAVTPLSWAAVTQLSNVFPPLPGPDGSILAWTPGPQLCNWIIAEIMRRSCKGDFLGEPPARTPMSHQTAGAVAIGMNGRFLLADEMRTGKSASALMGLAECKARNRYPWPALIVAPASVVDPWLEECSIVYPDWKAAAYRGTSRQRLLKSDAQILVTSWETMRNDVGDASKQGPLMKAGFRALVGDESHRICNHEALQSKRFCRLASHTPIVIEATGTPITSNAGNFWSLLNAMFPHAFPSRDRYKSHYCIGRSNQAYGDTEVIGLDPLREPEFRTVMQGSWRRVATMDVLTELPPKTYQTRWVEIPARYRAAYDGMEEDMLAEIPDSPTPLQAMSTLAKMMRLSQLAHAACDVDTYLELDDDPDSDTFGLEVEKIRVTMREPSWKVDALVEVLDELHEGDAPLTAKGELDRRRIIHGSHPVLAFAPLKQLVMLAGARAEKLGYKVGYIVGGISDKQRTATRLAFQNHEVDLLCGTGAMGTGLTLTAADTEVFLMRPWSFVESSQWEARGWGVGRTTSLQVIDLVTKDSIESRIRAALRTKAKNLAELVQDPRIARELLGGK